jgi:hypothetical protein
VILAGNSHLFALGISQAGAGTDPEALVCVADGPVRLLTLADPFRGVRPWSYWQAAARQCGGRNVAISWNGNQHQAAFLIAAGRPFDFVCPGAATDVLHPGAELVALSVIRAFFRPTLAGLAKVVALCQASGARRILVLGTPAPKGDDAFILGHIRRSAFFQRRAHELGVDVATMRLTPATIRQKLWTVLQQEMEAAARDAGAGFVPASAETQEPDGTLARAFWAEDATHANAAWGAAMRKALERAVLAEA